MEGNEIKLMLFQEIVCCCHNFYLWTFDEELHLIQSNCPDNELLQQWFLLCLNQADPSLKIFKDPSPVILTGAANIMWIAVSQFYEKQAVRLHALGPFFIDDDALHSADLSFLQNSTSFIRRQQVQEIFRTLPIISWSLVLDYTIMMHHCITGQKVSPSDFRYFNYMKSSAPSISKTDLNYTTHGTYQSEQTMVQMVRDGNLELLSYLDTIATTGQIGKLSNGDFMRQMKNSAEVGIILCSRAAIDGGISPELSYNLADQYFQAIESCQDLSDLTSVSNTMYRDYVERVHKLKMQQYSKPIAACCDYIMMHLEEEIAITDLAHHVGYSDYYCSKKFKKETGMTPAEYIRRKRLEAAANLLTSSNDDIQEIAARLQFGSQSYFTDSFRKLYGVSPREYRSAACGGTLSPKPPL
ncbi:AraC family transcriptional regulator [Lachnospiraceae bacterium]|jgi:AraC-like DNA-binding protein|nr:AraC family transcriptional regulator [Lachnospiraceae bacterium]